MGPCNKPLGSPHQARPQELVSLGFPWPSLVLAPPISAASFCMPLVMSHLPLVLSGLVIPASSLWVLAFLGFVPSWNFWVCLKSQFGFAVLLLFSNSWHSFSVGHHGGISVSAPETQPSWSCCTQLNMQIRSNDLGSWTASSYQMITPPTPNNIIRNLQALSLKVGERKKEAWFSN